MSAPPLTPEQRAFIATFLGTGDHGNTLLAPWPGNNVMEQARAAGNALRGALVAEVNRRAGQVALPEVPPAARLHEMTRHRVEPMVRGLFSKVEQEVVLALLERSVVFLTPDNIESVLREESFDGAAWNIANLYLGSIEAELLGENAIGLLGLSQETTCFVTAKYLEGRGKFDDFLVHEAAHVFHNWKREYAGLPHTRSKEWLLPIEFTKRETFAYACEVYSRIVEQGRTAKERQALLAEYSEHPFAGGEDIDEHLLILHEAVGARNGWKRILRRCAPKQRFEVRVTSNLVVPQDLFPWEREILAPHVGEILEAARASIRHGGDRH